MKARFLADADLHPASVVGVIARNRGMNFQIAKGVIADGPDPEVLALAQAMGFVLVSHDRSTMPRHFRTFTRTRSSPGVILIPQPLRIGAAI